ncbi:MAG: tRNA pseudouridine(13) synthase TruD [Litorilinea sp.]
MLPYTLTYEWPYSTQALPGIGGRLRAATQDFVVEEIPLYMPTDEGQHLYVNLTKEELTTKDVQTRLERLFGLKRGDVGFAGMKDKFARTTQTFSLSVGHQTAEQAQAFAQDAVTRIGENLPVTVHWARFHTNKLKVGHLLGNRFTIAVTDLACEPTEAMTRAQAIADAIQARGIPNYFGPQRFGPQGTNVTQGLEILQGQRKRHDRWLRKFLISSVQSYLCNAYLARRLDAGLFDRLLTGDVAKKYATGGIFVVEDLAADQPRYAAQEISFTAPIFGAKMMATQAEAREFEAGVIAEFPDIVEKLGAARTEGTRRLGRLLPHDLTVEHLPADDTRAGLQVTFFLPKGAFATTVLREFLKCDTEGMATLDTDADD